MRIAVISGVCVVFMSVAGVTTPALATHGTQQVVDAIDGAGSGNFSGSLDNAPDSADWYVFRGSSGTAVTVTMASSEFDTHLMLYSSPRMPVAGDDRNQYQLIAANDDHDGLNSRLDTVLPNSGYYVVAAESFSGFEDDLGDYTLAINGRVFGLMPTSTVECRSGGWRELADEAGLAFKNQGSCVSFVARRRP